MVLPEAPGTNAALGTRLVQAAADILGQISTAQDVVGLAWSEPLTALVRPEPMKRAGYKPRSAGNAWMARRGTTFRSWVNERPSMFQLDETVGVMRM
jgi:hypothetical protein